MQQFVLIHSYDKLRLSSFLKYVICFCLKSFRFLSAGRSEGPRAVACTGAALPADKIASLLQKHNGKEQDSGNNAT